MHTDITQKEMPTGSVNYPAGHTDTLIVPGIADPGNKAFVTLRAKFALRGHALYCTSPVDGAATYYAERWGQVRHLPTLDDAKRFLVQIGGAA
jgi:hypothetical protein